MDHPCKLRNVSKRTEAMAGALTQLIASGGVPTWSTSAGRSGSWTLLGTWVWTQRRTAGARRPPSMRICTTELQ